MSKKMKRRKVIVEEITHKFKYHNGKFHGDFKKISDLLFRFWAWWYLVWRTPNSDGAKIAVLMAQDFENWKDKVDDDLDAHVYMLAAQSGEFSDHCLEVLADGLGPWPTGDT